MNDGNKIIAQIRDIAVLPQVVHQVIDLTSNPHATAKELEAVISIDPGMSSRVLNTVNSAYYSLPRKIASIKEAVVFLGFQTIRHIATTAGMFELFLGKADRENVRRRQWWRHSIDVGLCARLIASQSHEASPEEAYTAGLLHDIGKPLLDRYGGEDYDLVEQLVSQGVPTLPAEQEIFTCEHAELGRLVSLHWRFPENLANAIGQHHEDDPAALEEPWLTAVTQLADWTAHLVRKQIEEEEPAPPKWTLEILKLTPNQLQAVIIGCEAELSESPLQGLAA